MSAAPQPVSANVENFAGSPTNIMGMDLLWVRIIPALSDPEE